MTNEQAAKHLERFSKSSTVAIMTVEEREALEKAVTALQHQPEPQYTTYRDSSAVGGQCESCGLVTSVEALSRQSNTAACPGCGLCDLRPIYEAK